jgi:hypothetical protein
MFMEGVTRKDYAFREDYDIEGSVSLKDGNTVQG